MQTSESTTQSSRDNFLQDKERVVSSIPLVIISKKSYIDKSCVHGQGLFSKSFMKADSVLLELDGQIVRFSDLEAVGGVQSLEWNALSTEWALLRALKTSYFFINHSRAPNVKIVPGEITPLKVVTLRDISAHEEFLLDCRQEPLPENYLSGHGASYL